ncbi:uncharacterized protein [Anoplolepis gracilipes]|uniref:uncharacterized protein isoform X2 n=1 Tax=Anoplolepis gracilipes TaxID=354296 RepID=UPI003B9F2A4A
METVREDVPFEITHKILKEKEFCNPLIQEENLNFSNVILETFQSNPNFIGQVDAETGEQNTFQQMREKSVTCAIWMQRMSIRPNDVITICTHNQLDAYVPFLAALYIGAIANPLDEHLITLENLIYFLKQTNPKMIFIDEKFIKAVLKFKYYREITNIATFRDSHRTKIVLFGETKTVIVKRMTLKSILKSNYNPEWINNFSCTKFLNMKETIIKLFTPGTTASPKLIEIPRSALFAPLDQLAPYMCENDVGLWFESLGFINGIFMTIRAIISHVKVIKIRSKFNTEIACKLIQQFKVTWAFFETTLFTQLVNSDALEKCDISSLRTIVYSGMTETGIIAYEQYPGKDESCGYVSRNVKLKINPINFLRNKMSNIFAPNIIGEIYCSSPYMMRKNHKTVTYNEEFNIHWFKTGDLGYYNEHGKIYVIGRINQQFIYNEQCVVFPKIIQSLLENHSAVFETVVIPIYLPFDLKDYRYSMAFVTKIPGKEVTQEELKQLVETFCKSRDKFKYIKLYVDVKFVREFPRTPNGKIYQKLLHNWVQQYSIKIQRKNKY